MSLPEHEKLYIASQYHNYVTGDLDKAIEAYQAYARAYPRDLTPHVNLAVQYGAAGQFEKAVEEEQQAIRLEPKVAVSYGDLVVYYVRLNRFDEAKATAERAFAQKIDSANLHNSLLQIAYMQGDQAGAQKEIQWASGLSEEYGFISNQAVQAGYLGQRRAARELSRRAGEMARRRNLAAVAAGYAAREANNDALMGSCDVARTEAHAAFALVNENTLQAAGGAATALARCGEVAEVEKWAGEVSKLQPTATIWNAVSLPLLRATMELKHDQPAKAIELLQSALPYERANMGVLYVRGLAGTGYALAYVGLARAAVLSSDTVKAKKAYQDFLALWKDADSDLPIPTAARKEYAALN